MFIVLIVVSVLLSSVVEGFRLTNSFQRKFTVCMSDVEETKVKVHQLFISNIPYEVDEGQLNTMVIDRSGKTFASIKLARDKKTGRSRGFGYIDYENEVDATTAVSVLQGLEVDGRALRVTVAEPRPERPAKTPQENSVFIGNLDFSVSEAEIMDMCNDILGPGSASRVRLVTDRETGRPRGFGHIDFNSPEDATRAIEKLNGIQLLNRPIRVDFARRKEEGTDQPERRERSERNSFKNPINRDHSIFLGNLPWDITQDFVEGMINDVVGPDLFLRVRLAVDKETGRPRGFGHIDFKDAESSERALVELNGLEVNGRLLRADMAQKKDTFGGSSSYDGGRGR